MNAKIIAPPIRIITNRSEGLMNKMQKAGITTTQPEKYINNNAPKLPGTSKNSKNVKNRRKYEKLANKALTEAFDPNMSTCIDYV